jgi:hypothetical protein
MSAWVFDELRKPMEYFLNGSLLGGGVLYKMFVTASSAVLERGRLVSGKGGGTYLRCDDL